MEQEKEKSLFEILNSVNVNEKVEKKNGLNYLSWAYAWGELKKVKPQANYKVYERTTQDGNMINYFTDGRTAWVKVGVIVDGLEHTEMLPVMDYKNQSIPLEKITSFNVNTAIQRALTKAIGRFGLGLYIYAGEDLPESESEKTDNDKNIKQSPNNALNGQKGAKIGELKTELESKASKITLTQLQKANILALCDQLKLVKLEEKYGKLETWSVDLASKVISWLENGGK